MLGRVPVEGDSATRAVHDNPYVLGRGNKHRRGGVELGVVHDSEIAHGRVVSMKVRFGAPIASDAHWRITQAIVVDERDLPRCECAAVQIIFAPVPGGDHECHAD